MNNILHFKAYRLILLIMWVPCLSNGQNNDDYFDQHNGGFINHYPLKKSITYSKKGTEKILNKIEYFNSDGHIIKTESYLSGGKLSNTILYDCKDSMNYSATKYYLDSIERTELFRLMSFDLGPYLNSVVKWDNSFKNYLVFEEKHHLIQDLFKVVINSLNGHVYKRDTIPIYNSYEFNNKDRKYREVNDTLVLSEFDNDIYRYDKFYSKGDTLLFRSEKYSKRASSNFKLIGVTFYQYDNKKRLTSELSTNNDFSDTTDWIKYNYIAQKDSLILTGNRRRKSEITTSKFIRVADKTIYHEEIAKGSGFTITTKKFYDVYGNLKEFNQSLNDTLINKYLVDNLYY